MKKLLLITLFLVASAMFANAQNDTILYMENYPNGGSISICLDRYQTVSIYAETGCTEFYWILGPTYSQDNPLIVDSQLGLYQIINYRGCNIPDCNIHIHFEEGRVPSSFTHNAWKHPGESLQLEAVGSDSTYYYSYHWSTGETTRTISVTEVDSYTCEIVDPCGAAVRTFIVQDNVEVELATCDLSTNLNVVTWPTTPAQAEYVSQVQIKRDGMVINTADYSAGTFIDNIGSDAASRTYTITAIGTDGVACPIESYPKETIHMAYLTGINNTIEVNWNTPTGYNLMGYNICEWHENDGSLNVIDYVGASVTSYTCQESLFDQGYIVVQGVENGKTESRLLSNRSLDIVGIGENEATAFKVYPNPANGVLFIETRHGTSLPVETYRIMNPIGQTVMEGQITSEKQQIDMRGLSNGVYFITVGGATRKFVVE